MISYLIYYCSSSQQALGRERFCEIKFNVKGGEKALEKELNINFGSQLVKEKHNYDCYQIGVEHDKNKRPIQSKPIFACCHNI